MQGPPSSFGKVPILPIYTKKNMMVADYYEQFNNLIKVSEAWGSDLGEDDGIVHTVLKPQGINPGMATAEEEENAKGFGKEWYFSLPFLIGLDAIPFCQLLENLRTNTLRDMAITP